MKQKSTASIIENNGTTMKKKHQFVRGFDHVDGNWPSHVYLEGIIDVIFWIHLCILSNSQLYTWNRKNECY